MKGAAYQHDEDGYIPATTHDFDPPAIESMCQKRDYRLVWVLIGLEYAGNLLKPVNAPSIQNDQLRSHELQESRMQVKLGPLHHVIQYHGDTQGL